MAAEDKANAMDTEHNPEQPFGLEGMLKSFAMTHVFKNRPLRRFHQTLKTKTSRVKAQVDKRFFRSNALSEALRQFSRRTFSNRRSISLQAAGPSKEKGRKWSALAMTLPSGGGAEQGGQSISSSLSSRTFTSGSSIPAFTLPDQGSIFSQVSTPVEKEVAKPKWKPPEPGARRFSRIEEIQPSAGPQISPAMSTASPAETTVQRSPKPGQGATPPNLDSSKTDLSVKPVQATSRQGQPPAPAKEKPDRQAAVEVSSSRLSPRQEAQQVSEPAPKASEPPARLDGALSAGQQVPVSQTPLAPAISQAPVPDRGQQANLSQPEEQAAGKAQPQMPSQEAAQPVQMPLAPRRVVTGVKKSRQVLLSQHRNQPSRPQTAMRKATPAIQRKSVQLPLKRRQAALPEQTSAGPQSQKPSSPAAIQPLARSEAPLSMPAKTPLASSPVPEIQTAASSTNAQSAAPSTQTLVKNPPLQRKSLYLPLKRLVLPARKPSAAQTRRLNEAAMPIRQTLAKVSKKKEDIGGKVGLPPRVVKTSPAKPARSSQVATPGPALPSVFTTETSQSPAQKADLARRPGSESAQTSSPESAIPIRLAQGRLEPTTPRADLAEKPGTSSYQAPALETGLFSDQSTESMQPADAAAMPSLPFPLTSKTFLQRLSNRRQLLQPRPMTRSQREPARFSSVRPGLSRVSKLPNQSIQRSLRKGYPLMATRISQHQEPEFIERLSGSVAQIPALNAETAHIEALQRPEKSAQVARATATKPTPIAESQTGSKAQALAPKLAAQVVLQPRRKTGATQAGITPVLPSGLSRSAVPSLSALRKGKPVLAPHIAKKASGMTGKMQASPQPKPESRPAFAGPVSRQSNTPIRAIKSTPVVQRKPEDEGFIYQSDDQNLPLASQPSGPSIGPASQSQSSFSSTSGRNGPGQSVPRPQSRPPEPPLPPSFSNPGPDEERPEMPLRTPPRPSTFESPSLSSQEIGGLPGSMLDESHSTDTGVSTPPQTEEQKRANLQELARKVYPEIIRMLNVETEWLGRRL